MSLALQFAERINALRYEDLPAEAEQWGKVAVLDTVGVTLAGSVEEAPRIVEDVLALPAGSGPCLIFGSRRRVTALDAALINGTAAHVLDYDNATNTMFGHISGTLLPALIAAGEAFGIGGRDLLLAHAAGFETGARIGRGVNMHHYKKGWHPTSTLGAFAVAAGCAKLLGLSVAQTQTALAMSASLAAGIKANFGSMTKPLHVGQCARGGLMAALLAKKGFTAHPEAIEHEHGFLNLFNGEGTYDIDKMLQGWGEPFDIVAPGACYKQYPSCGSTHSAVDAALQLRREHGPFDPSGIARIETYTSAPRLAHTNRPTPQSALDAKFSVQYCIACALLRGNVLLEHFENDAHRDAAIAALLPKIHAAPYSEQAFPGNLVGAEVRITLTDGRQLNAKLDRPVGRTSANPIAPSQMQAKFESCATRVLSAAQIKSVTQAIARFETIKSMRDFTALMETDKANVRAVAAA